MKYHSSQSTSLPTRFGSNARLAGLGVILVAICVALFAVSSPSPADAQTAPTLGDAESFAVLGGSTVTNTGPSIINGDLGVSPGTSVTGFPPGVVVNGTVYAGTAEAQSAQIGASAAYGDLDQACDFDMTGLDLGGLTLVPGVYCFASSAELTGTLTLSATDPDGVFIFKTGSTLTTASESSVSLLGADACNVYWRVGSSATLGTTTDFAGNIIALTSITLNTGATLDGRALALNGAVTLDSNTVDSSSCQQVLETPTPEPTATEIPPTETATAVPPTATLVPPTATAIPATATAVPPTATTAPPESTPTTTTPVESTATPESTPTTPVETPTTSTPVATSTPPGRGQVPPLTPTATPTSPGRGQVPPLTPTPSPSSTGTPVAPAEETGTPSTGETPTIDVPTPGAPSTGTGLQSAPSASTSLALGMLILAVSAGAATVISARRR